MVSCRVVSCCVVGSILTTARSRSSREASFACRMDQTTNNDEPVFHERCEKRWEAVGSGNAAGEEGRISMIGSRVRRGKSRDSWESGSLGVWVS